jgi:hypothetical protein
LAIFAPCTTQITSQKSALLFFERVVSRGFGFPQTIISDRDPRFASAFWQTLFWHYGTSINMSTAFHPQSDGQTERTNRTLEQMLRMWTDPWQSDWDTYLSSAEFAYNNARHDSTGFSPFYLVYGQHPEVPACLVTRQARTDDVPNVKAFIDRLEDARMQARLNLQKAQQRQKAHADQGRREVQFKEGDKVLLETANLKLHSDRARKLLPKRIGPYRVLARVAPNAYRIQLPPNMKMHDVFHVSQLMPYTGQAVPQLAPPQFAADTSPVPVRILKHRDRSVGRSRTVHKEYLVQWEGGGIDLATWTKSDELPPQLVADYWAKNSAVLRSRTSASPAAAAVSTPLRRCPRGLSGGLLNT